MIESLDLTRALAALPVPLPPGRPVTGEEGEGRRPLLWISDAPAPDGLWERLHRAHPETGLWPLLLAPLDGGPDFRPWLSGELYPDQASDLSHHDPAVLLRDWWDSITPDPEEDDADLVDALAPYVRTWPGLAPAAAVPDGAADREARGLAGFLQPGRNVRLGLVRADSGAEALVACGWSGPVNHENDIAKIAAVLAGWERRFGARVVEVGFDTLQLSVAVPPATLAEALPVAAEHTALCSDLVFQGTGTLTAYAEQLVGSHLWHFWWD
ncbi:DUF4253 domain-containing protein [Kitasatospora sp. NPDC093806]|uniref:DUF4253 domain-containing protein n=1 Tax=Kitasatospora sp. NPDC093806 TaxID=3155075 RepID=UPI00343007E5